MKIFNYLWLTIFLSGISFGHTMPVYQPVERRWLRPIPTDLTFEGGILSLHQQALAALVGMGRAAQQEGIQLKVISAYRSADTQEKILKRKMTIGSNGQQVLQSVALPAHTTHQTGMAIDLYPNNFLFYQTPAYRWLKKNSTQFGFIELFPENNTHGMNAEPWHFMFTSR
jgi:zinc D-Ala-D-Ala carboxypeptidase